MKHFISIALLIFSLQLFAQEPPTPIEEPIFETKDIDIQPEFPGGIENCYAFFNKNFKKPNVPSLIGKIFLSFVVETNGTLTGIRILKDVGFGAGAEAERVMQFSPKWIPGKKNDKLVRVNYILPLPIQTE
jgi:protein TonB